MKRVGVRTVAAVMAAIATLSALAIHSAGAAQERKEQKVADFMRPKLNYAQKILEGLTTENYAMIAENARALGKLSDAAEWAVLPSLEYTSFSMDFRRLASEVARSANKKNLDGATLAYVQLTMNCVNCHKHTRESKAAAK